MHVQVHVTALVSNIFFHSFHLNCNILTIPDQFPTFPSFCFRLYHNGARKFALFGAGVVGCTPNSISLYDTKGKACVEEINNAVTIFNQQLIPLVDNLSRNLTSAKIDLHLS